MVGSFKTCPGRHHYYTENLLVNLMDEVAAFERDDSFGVSGCPAVFVAVEERNCGSFSFAASEFAVVAAFPIDGSDGSIFLDEGDGEELTFGFVDQLL